MMTTIKFSLLLLLSQSAWSAPIRVTRNHLQRSDIGQRQDKTWAITDVYEGANFLDNWDFFTDPDPTHGNVAYQSQQDATSKGLAQFTDNVTVLAVDDFTTLPEGGNRDSVRISTKKTYNGGLFVADFAAMPSGCSLWPAWWSVGPNWPAGGEIDVLEGVQAQGNNAYHLHTSDGCTLDSSQQMTGTIQGTQCLSSNGDNNGCG